MGANEEFGMWNAEWKRFSQSARRSQRTTEGKSKKKLTRRTRSTQREEKAEFGIRNAEFGMEEVLTGRTEVTEDHGGEEKLEKKLT